MAKLGYDSPLQEMSGLSRAYYLGGILLCIVRHFLPNEELTHLHGSVDQLRVELEYLASNPDTVKVHITEKQLLALEHTCQALEAWSTERYFSVHQQHLSDVLDLLPLIEAVRRNLE